MEGEQGQDTAFRPDVTPTSFVPPPTTPPPVRLPPAWCPQPGARSPVPPSPVPPRLVPPAQCPPPSLVPPAQCPTLSVCLSAASTDTDTQTTLIGSIQPQCEWPPQPAWCGHIQQQFLRTFYTVESWSEACFTSGPLIHLCTYFDIPPPAPPSPLMWTHRAIKPLLLPFRLWQLLMCTFWDLLSETNLEKEIKRRPLNK